MPCLCLNLLDGSLTSSRFEKQKTLCSSCRSRATFEQQEQRLSADMQKVEAQVSPAHLAASRGTTPGSPATGITARVDDQLVGYRDLAALPRDKAILQRSLSPPAPSPIMSPEVKARRAQSETDSVSPAGSTLTLQKRRSQQHFHTPDNGDNIYMKPPIYKQDVIKVSEGLTVIRSAMFPAAQPPDPNLPSKIETDGDAEMLREQELEKIKSNLGRLILKEEKEKAVQYRRKTQSLPDRTHMHTKFEAETQKAAQREFCVQMQSAEFASEKGQPACRTLCSQLLSKRAGPSVVSSCLQRAGPSVVSSCLQRAGPSVVSSCLQRAGPSVISSCLQRAGPSVVSSCLQRADPL
ncbi:Dematin [Dissostichus eleginoides]|uniref:Dematin n=1 Tax=Dissostichus eleginoides TaxID=100907 RepID=A0AAD9EX21_DISEL|nr:Dematin [Dissostichus eleginoides]